MRWSSSETTSCWTSSKRSSVRSSPMRLRLLTFPTGFGWPTRCRCPDSTQPPTTSRPKSVTSALRSTGSTTSSPLGKTRDGRPPSGTSPGPATNWQKALLPGPSKPRERSNYRANP
ncbi:hypothetical protein ACFFX0_25630 [Citricoccus parietis]|uniref:Uncharacterized protein n=1 Tax=Citricoccus parietis TaxID=592307 RepID=A0ABV5G6Z0_9MICC